MADVIVGTNLPTYTPTPSEVGKNIYCRVKAINVAGFAFRNSALTGLVAPATAPLAPSILTAPAIADLIPVVDEVLHTTDGLWDGDLPMTFNYQWHRVTVAPTNTGGTFIDPVDPQVGDELSVTDGTWTGTLPMTFSYQWKRFPSTNIGIDASTYTTVPLDEDENIYCVVTATNVAGSDSTNAPTVGPVAPADSAPSGGVPSIADVTPQVDEVLHVDRGTWAGYPAPTYTYQWYQVGTVPVITSSATASNVENTALAHTLTADQSVTWSKVGGADSGKFTLTGVVLSWTSTTKNFEAPDDVDTNNAYVVVVRATATTGQTTDQTVTVTVSDVVEATLTFDFTANTSTIAGAASTAVAPITVTRTGTAAWAESVSGIWTNFAANTARRTDKGLLIEEARTNICLQNRTQTNASWVKTTCTAAKTQIGIDGVANSCCSLTASAGNATCLVTCTISSSARFQTAFIKRLVGTGNIQMTMDNGTTWTTLTITSSWARYSIPTQTLANPVVGFRIVTSGDSIAVDMVQNENSALFATSPISTTTATVARPADAIVVNTGVAPIASWFTQPQGTLFVEGNPHTGNSTGTTLFQIDDGTTNNRHLVGLSGVGFSGVSGGTTTASVLQASKTDTSVVGTNKAAWAYALNDFASSYNGAAVVLDTSGTIPSGLTTTRIGNNTSVYWNGYLRKMTYYNGRMANADLVTLTT